MTAAKFFNLSPVDHRVQRHLQSVYATLAVALLACTTGVAAHIRSGFSAPPLASLFVFGLLIWIQMTPQAEVGKRISILSAFAFLQGLIIAPLVSAVAAIDPVIPATALLLTAAVFASFSAAAIFAPSRSYLFLGGFLGSAILGLLVLSLVNIFLQVEAIFLLQLYGGLVVFCGYVIYDTQIIIERAKLGWTDTTMDALNLFVDIVAIFVRILIAMAKNSLKKK
eukprot:TRINITY_DN378_c0_g1_i1.p1 TRINITY_DN378_c0_g1~~TRINITY_DN378_c0_g1_i1.p1  ORF type:complete len:253 (-),score=70.40 TRINITY_DN378_c0_g1_i1:25-696(-)